MDQVDTPYHDTGFHPVSRAETSDAPGEAADPGYRGLPEEGESTSVAEDVAMVIVPMSYCYVFAATQGLISVIKDAYGDKYVAWYFACFFIPGLPCAVIQSWYDIDFDLRYGSWVTFQARMLVSFVVLLGSAVALTVNRDQATILAVISVVGIATWFAHGTCTQLVHLLPPRATVQAQMGFQLSNILALVLVLGMQVNNYDLHNSRISAFYGAAIAVVFLGAVSWLAFLQRTESTSRLEHRDDSLALSQAESPRATEESDQNQLTRDSYQHGNLDVSIGRRLLTSANLDALPAEYAETYYRGVLYCVICIFVNIASSNVMGALFAFIDNSDSSINIATALVFCRLLSDAASRPVAHIWRPGFAETPLGLLVSSLLRAALVSIFFMYEADVFGTADWFIMTYMIITSFMSGLLSTFSYVASREVCMPLPAEFREAALAHSAYCMNMSFNAAGFFAAFISVGIAYAL